jgi:ESS family glutamate:Na+ symporter
MSSYQLDPRQTIIVAILVLYLGKYLTSRIKFLQDFNIPSAVSGGVLASLVFGLCFVLFKFQINFDLQGRDTFLIIFFSTIGLSSRIKTLFQGGKPLLILLTGALIYLFIQNLTGVSVAALLGLKLPIGLLSGTISLTGGHGTVVAWSSIFKDIHDIPNASEIGVASATFGLVMGGVIGGPVAKFLIIKNRLKAKDYEENLTVGIKHDQRHVQIDYDTMVNSILVIAITIGLGSQINNLISLSGLKLPLFVTCILAGIFLTNTVPFLFKRFPWPTDTPCLALISDVSLGLFLAVSLMSLQLWTLVDIAGPITVILLVQTLVLIAYTVFLLFPAMGKNYDAAVCSAGYLGLSLGATPTAIANMTAVTRQMGASPQSFIIVPLVGAFFIDIANAFIIQHFLSVIG